MPRRDDSEPRSCDLVFVHSSDEMYGADRVLLRIVEALPPEILARTEVWVPTDLDHPERSLCAELETRGAVVRHVDVPVLRRAYRTPVQLLRLARRAWRLRTDIRRTSPRTVYCATSATFLVGPLARWAGVERVVGHVHEMWSDSDRRVLGALARSLDELLAISGPVRDRLGPGLAQRALVLPNGVATPAVRSDLNVRSGPLRFLVASRWNGWKGHRTLLEAWDRLEAPGELVVLGGPPLSGEYVDVPTLVASLRRPETVHIVGEVPDIAVQVDLADVVIVPSDDPEPFGLVAIEAFAQGRPVVASRGGGLLEIVTDGHDGWFFAPGSPDDLARVLRGLDRAAVTLAGATAARTHQTRFTDERFVLDWQAAVRLT